MKYRMLKAGEMIEESDEFNIGTRRKPAWGSTAFVGFRVKKELVGYYRRPIFEPIPVSNFSFYRGRIVKHD